MTGKQFIEAYEWCTNHESCDDNCPSRKNNIPCIGDVHKDARDLIIHQKAEIEALIAGQETLQKYRDEEINSLKAEIESLKKEKDILIKTYTKCQIATLKEFAERLKKLSRNLYPFSDEPIIDRKDIDNLVKEMVGASDG